MRSGRMENPGYKKVFLSNNAGNMKIHDPDGLINLEEFRENEHLGCILPQYDLDVSPEKGGGRDSSIEDS